MASQSNPLKSKVILITGAEQGIGKHLALAAAKRGAQLALHYYKDQDQIEATALEVDKLGGNSIILNANLAEANQVEFMTSQLISQFKQLDYVFNNVSMISTKPFLNESVDYLHKLVLTNIIGFTNVMFCASKTMSGLDQGGTIVNLIRTNKAKTKYPVYSATQAAINTFSIQLKPELKSKNIHLKQVSIPLSLQPNNPTKNTATANKILTFAISNKSSLNLSK